MGVGVWLDESWGKMIVWVFRMDGWVLQGGQVGVRSRRKCLGGCLVWEDGSRAVWTQRRGAVGTTRRRGCHRGSPSTPWWAHGNSEGAKNPLLGVSRGQDNFSSMQCGSPGVG